MHATEEHHNLPRKYETNFKRAGFDIEDFVEEMETKLHRLKPEGLHTGPNNWNKLWKQFWEQYKDEIPAPDVVIDALNKFRDMWGLPPWGG